jgi:serine/threonine protein kinase
MAPQQNSLSPMQQSPFSQNQLLNDFGLERIEEVQSHSESGNTLNLTHRKRKRSFSDTHNESYSRPGKRSKSSTLDDEISPPSSEQAVAELFEWWKSNNPQGAKPSKANFRGFELVTRLSYQELHERFYHERQILPTSNKPSIASSSRTDDLSVLLDQAARQLPARRYHCLEKNNVSVEQRETNRLKDWDPAKMYSCTSCCGHTYKKKSDWERHENGNRPQRAWLCNHALTWKNRCSFCNQDLPDQDHIKLAHKGRIPCCDKSSSLDSSRVFLRQSHLMQHFKNTHPYVPFDNFGDMWKYNTQQTFDEKCGFCGYPLGSWSLWTKHIGDHFEDGMTMNHWQEPWETHELGPIKKPEDEDSDQEGGHDDDGSSGDDDNSDDDRDNGKEGNHDKDTHEQSYGNAADNLHLSINGNFEGRQCLDHDSFNVQAKQRTMFTWLPNSVSQLGLCFQTIFGRELARLEKLPGIVSNGVFHDLSFRELATIIRHTVKHVPSPISMTLRPPSALLKKDPILEDHRFICTTQSSTRPAEALSLPKSRLIAFWLQDHSRRFTYEPLHTVDILGFGLLGAGAASYVEKIAIRGHTQMFARKSPRNPSLQHRLDVLRELSMLSRLNHRHVIQGLGVLLENSRCSLIMTPVADCTLHDVLKPKVSSHRPSPSKSWLGCLSSALNSVHQENISHRDIKPANILVSHNRNGDTIGRFELILTDFGISTDRSDPTLDTSAPHGMTPLYAAPELHTRGRPGIASDIFSLGLVFLEMITVLAGRTTGDLHSFVFSDLPNDFEKAYWRKLDRIHIVLDLYRQTLHEERPSSTEWLSLGQLEMLTNMLQFSPSLRPRASEVMHHFSPGPCCGERTIPSFSRRCARCKQLEDDNEESPFVVNYQTLYQSATLDGCNMCSLFLKSLVATLQDELLFSGELTWNAGRWLFISTKDQTETLLEFFTLPCMSFSHSLFLLRGASVNHTLRSNPRADNSGNTKATIDDRRYIISRLSKQSPSVDRTL